MTFQFSLRIERGGRGPVSTSVEARRYDVSEMHLISASVELSVRAQRARQRERSALTSHLLQHAHSSHITSSFRPVIPSLYSP